MTKLLCIVAFAALTVGCAGPTPPVRDTNHPGNPDAAPGPSTRPMSLTEDESAPPATDESQPMGGHHHVH